LEQLKSLLQCSDGACMMSMSDVKIVILFSPLQPYGVCRSLMSSFVTALHNHASLKCERTSTKAHHPPASLDAKIIHENAPCVALYQHPQKINSRLDGIFHQQAMSMQTKAVLTAQTSYEMISGSEAGLAATQGNQI